MFHLGAQTIVGTAQRNPLSTFEANIRGTWNLLEACRVHATLVKRVVVASSDKAYGDAREAAVHRGHAARTAAIPTTSSKSCTDLIALSLLPHLRLPVAVARCGNLYGGGDLNWNRIVPGTIRVLAARRAADHPQRRHVHARLHLRATTRCDAYLALAERIGSRRASRARRSTSANELAELAVCQLH